MVERMVESAMLEDEKNESAQDETKLMANIIPAKKTSFYTTLRLKNETSSKHSMANMGGATPRRIAT